MSVLAWVRRYRDRPTALRERASATLTVAILLIVCLAGLLLTRPATPSSERRFEGTSENPHERTSIKDSLSPGVRRAAEGFLAGYLAYLYGHGQANRVKDATASLTRSLEANPPRVPPGLDELKPRVLKLLAAPAPSGLIGVTAIVSDQEIVNYRIPLLLTRHQGRFLISGLDAR